MWVKIENLRTVLVRGTDEERVWLREYLTFTDVTRRHRTKDGSDQASMFNEFSSSFPTGLLAPMRAAAKEDGIDVQVADVRVCPAEQDGNADLAWLYDYQREAVDKICDAARGILWCPTGSGKTEIAIGIARALPIRWVFLVHRATLMKQAADRYELRNPGLKAGRIGESVWDVPEDATFICATFQTIAKRIKHPSVLALLEGAEGIMVDECHVLPSETFWNVAMKTPNAYFRIGLSGTPLARGDRKSLLAIAALGGVVYRIKAQELIDRGKLAKPRIELYEFRQQSKHKSWPTVKKRSIVENQKRNELVVKLAKRATKPAFLFVTEIKHGKTLEKMLWKAGMSAGFVWGSHSTQWRDDAVKQLVQSRLEVLVTSTIFQEGVDVPELRSVIIACGGKSVIAALQRIGRGMRVERDADGNVVEGGDTFEVYDIADGGCRCKVDSEYGMHKGCEWLEKHTRFRTAAYASEGFETTVRSALSL
jgi:superfamily II DNA or RNA helicase